MAHPPATVRRLTLRTLIRTAFIHAWLWADLCFFVLVLGPYLYVAGRTFDPHRRRARAWARRLFCRVVRTGAGRGLTVEPFDFSAAGGPCIVVANHQSMLDIVLLMMLPLDGRCWAKGWPFRVPLLGILMKLCGHLHVDDFNVLPDAADSLLAGSSLLVFPEGTRSRTGRLGRFHDGAFLLAVRTGRPIVPVALHGSHECLPPGQPCVFPPNLRIQPLGLLWPNPHDPKAHLTLKRQAKAMIAAALEPARAAEAESAAA